MLWLDRLLDEQIWELHFNRLLGGQLQDLQFNWLLEEQVRELQLNWLLEEQIQELQFKRPLEAQMSLLHLNCEFDSQQPHVREGTLNVAQPTATAISATSPYGHHPAPSLSGARRSADRTFIKSAGITGSESQLDDRLDAHTGEYNQSENGE